MKCEAKKWNRCGDRDFIFFTTKPQRTQETEKMKFDKNAPRYGAGHGELKGGTGGIIKMCPAVDYLEVYKVDKTFRIYTPESLDPKETDPNMS